MRRKLHRRSFTGTALVLVGLFAVSLLGITSCGKQAASLKEPTKTPGKAIPVSKTLTQEDLLYADIPFGPDMSPDGTHVMWCTGKYREGNELPGWKMFVADLATLSTTQVAEGELIPTVFPKWSPDGAAFAFIIAAPDGSNQLFTLPAQGGTPTQLTNEAGGITAFGWRSPGTIVFTRQIPGAESAASATAGDDTIHVTETTDDKVRLFQVDPATDAVKQLTSNDDQITAFWVSPDGARAFVTRTRATHGGDTYYEEIPTLNYLVDLESGREQQVFKSIQNVVGATWSTDSETLYVQWAKTREPANTTTLQALNVKSGGETEVGLGWSRGIHSQTNGTNPLHSIKGGFMTLLADGANPKLAIYSGSGGTPSRSILKGAHQGNIFNFDVSSDGKTACYYYSTPSRPPQLYTAAIAGGSVEGPRQVSNLNTGWESKEFTRSETITWEGALGEPVEGILTYPNGYVPGKRYPLMLMLHGGPDHVDLDEWASMTYTYYPYQMVAQKGAFVLAPNYHGSTDYGLDFVRSVSNGKFYQYPLEDIEKAITVLSDKGMVDLGRLGTMGWSNGSILSQALIASDQRFKVASCGAGGNEWVSLWGQSKLGYSNVEFYFGASPVEDPGLFKDPKMAPLYNAKNVRTPVVMYQGSADDIVPPDMSWIAFRGLQKYSKAPVEFFIFPGEGHGPIMLSHLKRKLSEDMKWFDKYLFGTGK